MGLKVGIEKIVIPWSVFFIGLLVMSYGIALMIRANLGCAPWDVLHIGLYKHLGLTVGTWSIIVGAFIVGTTSILTKKWPLLGAVFNMILVGIFIDFFLRHTLTPSHLLARYSMLVFGILVNGVGTGIYIAARRGAGPRDALMLFLMEQTGFKLTHVRRFMEVCVLTIGWFLGGPVSIGTVIYGVTIGSIVGKSLPLFERITGQWIERSRRNEDFNKRQVRANHHDGAREALREGTPRFKSDREGA